MFVEYIDEYTPSQTAWRENKLRFSIPDNILRNFDSEMLHEILLSIMPGVLVSLPARCPVYSLDISNYS